MYRSKTSELDSEVSSWPVGTPCPTANQKLQDVYQVLVGAATNQDDECTITLQGGGSSS